MPFAEVATATDAAVDLVIKSIFHVGWPTVQVAQAPAFVEDSLAVCYIVAIDVLQEIHMGGLSGDDPAVDPADGCEDGEAFCEGGKLVGLAVTVTVFAENDAVGL